MTLPVLISIPHGGLAVPDRVRPLCLLNAGQIAADGDEGALDIYDFGEEVAAVVRCDIARAVVDMNRAEEDFGRDGVVKTHTSWDEPVWKSPLDEDTVRWLLESYHRPYHSRLRALARGDARIGVDCHTMAAVGPPSARDVGRQRPEICLSDGDGTLPAHWFMGLARGFEESFGLPVSLNAPFGGGHIIRSHGAELPWVQVELSRAPFLSIEEKRKRILEALRLFCGAVLQ